MKSMRTIIVAILFTSAIVSWAIVERYSASENSTATVVVNDTAPPRQPIAVADSNNDGVPDWQEMVVGTKTVIERSTSSSLVSGPRTLTDEVSQELFTQFIDRAYNGNRLYSNQEFTSTLANQVLAAPTETPLTEADITIAQSESINSLKLYGDRIAMIIERYGEDAENELFILNNALRVQDPALLDELGPKIATYDTYFNETKALSVPPSLVTPHLNLLNSYQALRNDIAGFQVVFNDPVRTLTRIQDYQRHAEDMAEALITIYGELVKAGVSVTPSDPSFAIINALSQ